MRFYKTEISGPFVPDVAHTRSVGSAALPFLTAYADTFYGALIGNVDGRLLGDVYSDDGISPVLENGGNTPANATFTGTATKAKYA